MKIFVEEEKELVLPSEGEEQVGGAYTFRNESEDELLREMLTPTLSEQGSSEKREEVESSEKNKLCLMKMMALSLACMASAERKSDQEWV